MKKTKKKRKKNRCVIVKSPSSVYSTIIAKVRTRLSRFPAGNRAACKAVAVAVADAAFELCARHRKEVDVVKSLFSSKFPSDEKVRTCRYNELGVHTPNARASGGLFQIIIIYRRASVGCSIIGCSDVLKEDLFDV